MKNIKLLPSNYYVIIDFEATCDRGNKIPKDKMEIIEFAGIIVDTDFNIIKEFTQFIKPVIRPKLSKFCIEFTSIKQLDVDTAKYFPEVLKDFEEFIKPYNPIFVSWGNYDRNQLKQDCRYHNVAYPFDHKHVNIKRQSALALKISPRGIQSMLKYLQMKFEGRAHRGIDDVRNIIRIVRKIEDRIHAQELQV